MNVRNGVALATGGGRAGHSCRTGSEHSLGFQHAGSGIHTGAKHAVLGIADVLRHDWPANIGVSVLCPGLAKTNLSTSGDYGPLPPSDFEAQGFAKTILSLGMESAVVGKAAVDGVVRGDDADRHFLALDGLLEGQDWLVGDKPTTADFAVADQLNALLFAVEAREALERSRHIQPWKARLDAAAPIFARREG